MASSSLRFRPLAVAGIVFASLLTAACAPTDIPGSSPAPESASSQGPVPGGSATPEPTEEVIVSESVDTTCDALLTPDDVYAFNPNFSLISDGKPKVDSKAGQIAGMNGLTCQWVNNSSNEPIDLAVARLTDDQLTALKNLAVTESTQVQTYAAPPAEGYFTVIGSEGEAQIFSGPYWVALRSVAFSEPGDAEQLAEAVIAHLPA